MDGDLEVQDAGAVDMVYVEVEWGQVAANVFLDPASITIWVLASFYVHHGCKAALVKHTAFTQGGVNKDGEDEEPPVQLTWKMAVAFPAIASVGLLVVFLFFDDIQFIYILLMIAVTGPCLEDTMRPWIYHLWERVNPYMSLREHVNVPKLGRMTTPALLSILISTGCTASWVLSGEWYMLDLMGFGLCCFMMSTVQLDSLKVCAYLYAGLLLYDIFWVFFSARVFTSNVMMDVATKRADNPVSSVANALNLPIANSLPAVELPAKIMVPSVAGDTLSWHMLGLGDIVLPGLVVAYVQRFDMYRPNQPPYYWKALAAYIVSLLVAMLFGEAYQSAQPALIYLVPGTLGVICCIATLRGDLLELWTGEWAAKKTDDRLSTASE